MKAKIFFLISVLCVLFSLYPTWYEIQRRNDIREDRYFELVHNFYTDFNFYLSRIRQGLEGNITVHEKYTSEPHQGSFIHIMYLAMGWVGRWVRVPWHRTSDIYHMSRVVLAMALLLITAEIAKRSFKQTQIQSGSTVKYIWQLIAFLFAVTASTYPKFVHLDDGSWRIGGYMPWWSVMDSLQRITFIPHLVAGQTLVAAILFASSDIVTVKKITNILFLGILSFALGIIFPPGLIFIAAAFGMMVVVEWFFHYKDAIGKKFIPWILTHTVPRILVIVIAVPAILYLQLMVSFFPWKQLALADILHPLPFKYGEYFQAMGIMLPLGLLGFLLAIRNKERSMVLPMSWVAAWGMLLFVFNYIPQQSPLRFSEMIPHVPLGILSAYVFYDLFYSKSLKVLRVFKVLIVVTAVSGLILLNFLHMFSSWLWQRDFVDHKIRALYPLVPTGSYVMYPLKDFIEAIRWLQDHTTRDTVILSETTTGNYIPVYAGNYVYVGHENTVNSDEKKMFVRSFYSMQMPVPQALEWLKSERLEWVFVGPQELEDAGGQDIGQHYPFLERIFKNNYVSIFKVK